VYDMYPWNGASTPSAPSAAEASPGLTQAVQVALDRRDNGGDAAAEPTAGRTRQ
jgi:hypothetical protein